MPTSALPDRTTTEANTSQSILTPALVASKGLRVLFIEWPMVDRVGRCFRNSGGAEWRKSMS
jgi:hypothetical protein